MKTLRHKLPRRTIRQHRHGDELFIGWMRPTCGGRWLGRKFCRMRSGNNRSWSWYNNSLSFRRRNETEVFGFELVPGKDISQGRPGLGSKRRIILSIFMGVLIKEQYF